MKRKCIVCGMLLLLLSSGMASAEDDFQTWSQLSLKIAKREKAEFIFFSDSRLVGDARKLGLYFFSPRFVYHWAPGVDLGLNYTYLQSRNISPTAVDDSFNTQHRAEIEVNPYWKLAEALKLKMRNRVEFRWLEGQGADNPRYRQRWVVEWVPKTFAPVKSLYASTEFIIDFHREDYVENRSVPIGINLKINERAGLQVYYMIQSLKGSKDWSSNQVLGTMFSFEF